MQTVASFPLKTLDTLVLGQGPAGLAAAAALCAQGLRVGVLGPPGAVHWPAQYGAWLDELAGLNLPNIAEQVWPESVVGLGAAGTRILHRPYARVNKSALAAVLLDRCDRGGARWIVGEAVGVRHEKDTSVVRLRDGRDLTARLVVDASGHRPALLGLSGTQSQGFQTAVGWTIEAEVHPFAAQRATLMDWNASSTGTDSVPPPSFLYAMPFGDGRIFIEETVLVARPAVPAAVLEARLQRRCDALGIRVRRILEREQVWIPMGGGIPSSRNRVVGFGGAARMVHPATGYMLARVLAAAPALGEAIGDGLGAGAPPQEVARTAWDAIWPADRRRRHALFQFGMETVLRLDTEGLQKFFATFFSLPEAEWQGYLSDQLSTRELASVMARLFAHAPNRIRHTLFGSAMGANGARLAASLLASSRA